MWQIWWKLTRPKYSGIAVFIFSWLPWLPKWRLKPVLKWYISILIKSNSRDWNAFVFSKITFMEFWRNYRDSSQLFMVQKLLHRVWTAQGRHWCSGSVSRSRHHCVCCWHLCETAEQSVWGHWWLYQENIGYSSKICFDHDFETLNNRLKKIVKNA